MKKLVVLAGVIAITSAFGEENVEFNQIKNIVGDNGVEINYLPLANGIMGDFLVKVPETPDLRKIADKEKDSMFLSTQNPNQYSQDDFCLINVIPASVLQKQGWGDSACYRIYCGGPEYMDYDKYYAVQICEN